MQRDTWYRVSCIVTRKDDEERLLKSLSGRILTDPHALPQFHLDTSYYLGEYPWEPSLAAQDDWAPAGGWSRLGAPTRPTTAGYLCEKGNYDYSIDETIRIELPAPWLSEAMGLRLRDGRQPTFVDRDGQIRFFDPSVSEPGYQAGLVDRDFFLAMLEREGLAPIWIIAGEKGVFGGGQPNRGFGGRVLHTGIYRLGDNGPMLHEMHTEHERPRPEQLQAFLGKKKPKLRRRQARKSS